jgi:nicotinate-nucleotide adenylyltransferase
MRVGLFGGTFDPVHYGHLILAEQCREQGRFDQVWFVPAARPPHKADHALTRFDRRVEMLQLAAAGNPAFRVEALEADRPGPSYTADTAAELHHRHPGHDFWLLVGADTLADLGTWHEPARLVGLVGLLAVARPGHPVPPDAEVRARLGLPDGVALRYETVDSPLIDISSRDLRLRAAAGRSLRYFLPRAVEVYIHEKKLYRGEGDGPA